MSHRAGYKLSKCTLCNWTVDTNRPSASCCRHVTVDLQRSACNTDVDRVDTVGIFTRIVEFGTVVWNIAVCQETDATVNVQLFLRYRPDMHNMTSIISYHKFHIQESTSNVYDYRYPKEQLGMMLNCEAQWQQNHRC